MHGHDARRLGGVRPVSCNYPNPSGLVKSHDARRLGARRKLLLYFIELRSYLTPKYPSAGVRTWQKFGIFHLKRQARKLAVLKLSSGPQTFETCEDVANDGNKDVKSFDGRSGPYGPAIGGPH